MKLYRVFIVGFSLTAALYAILIVIRPAPIVVVVSNTDQAILGQEVRTIEEAIGNGDVRMIFNLLSPRMDPTLRRQMEETVSGKARVFREQIKSYNEVSPDQIRIEGTFFAITPVAGVPVKIKGFSNYFVFEKTENRWLLLDTNVHSKLRSKIIWLLFLPLALPLLFFLQFMIRALAGAMRTRADREGWSAPIYSTRVGAAFGNSWIFSIRARYPFGKIEIFSDKLVIDNLFAEHVIPFHAMTKISFFPTLWIKSIRIEHTLERNRRVVITAPASRMNEIISILRLQKIPENVFAL